MIVGFIITVATVALGIALGLQAHWCRWFYAGEHRQ